ncbi:MAG: TadG family pilus assembly protein, partial [Planctomycetota bacterium]|nr:TadG family pilus assembly protein [Planctomycetota bacterium]
RMLSQIRTRERRAATTVLVVLTLPLLIGFIALAVDVGLMCSVRADLQNAADAGALSAAIDLGGSASNGDRLDAASAAAVSIVQSNGVFGKEQLEIDTDADLVFGRATHDEGTGKYNFIPTLENPNAVQVTVRCTDDSPNGAVDLFFAAILGKHSANISATSVAMLNTGSCGGIIGLNRVYLREESYTDSYNSIDGVYVPGSGGDNGDVCSNGHIRLISSAGINGDATYGPDEDGVDINGDSYVTGEQTGLENEIDYPPVDPGNAPFSNDNDSIPLSTLGNDPLAGGGFALGSGGGGGGGKKGDKGGDGGDGGADSIILFPGTYYFSSLDLFSGSVINVIGPTVIYIDGDVDLTDGGIVNQTLIPKNLQLYPMGGQFWLPDNIDLHAVIYSTTSAIEKRGGSGSFYGKLVGQKVKINGSGGLHVDDSVSFSDLTSGGPEIGGPQQGVMLIQ